MFPPLATASQLILLTSKARPRQKLSDETPSTRGAEPLGLPHGERYVRPAHSPEVTSPPTPPPPAALSRPQLRVSFARCCTCLRGLLKCPKVPSLWEKGIFLSPCLNSL